MFDAGGHDQRIVGGRAVFVIQDRVIRLDIQSSAQSERMFLVVPHRVQQRLKGMEIALVEQGRGRAMAIATGDVAMTGFGYPGHAVAPGRAGKGSSDHAIVDRGSPTCA